jgi:hypothetical protein
MRTILRLALLCGLLLGAGPAFAARWQPAPGTSFEWILDGYAGTIPSATAIDTDLFETSATTVARLHAHGKKVICYINVGAWENWRPDKASFPPSVIGRAYDGWAGERWLDIRKLSVLAPILAKRMDRCKAKGFDAIEPDNLDGYQQNTGFPITRADQLRFINWLSDAAHRRGLSIGLKNVPEFVPLMVTRFDWALTEDCYDQGWCADMTPFIAARKAVFAVEYTDTGINFAAAEAAHPLRLEPPLPPLISHGRCGRCSSCSSPTAHAHRRRPRARGCAPLPPRVAPKGRPCRCRRRCGRHGHSP